MTDDKQHLRIGYDGPWDTELETELYELLAKHGYDCYESHYDLIASRRDLYYDRPVKEDEAECPSPS